MDKKISVILPYYNNKTTIERCMESILDQTYPHFEVLAVCDSATDGTEEIVHRYAMMDSRVIPVHVPHGGVSRARNAGLIRAEGDFLQFVDADDYLAPNMFETMLGALLKEHADICACGFTHPCMASFSGDRVFDFTDPDDIYAYYQDTFAGHIPWNKLYRRDIVKTPFIEGLDFSEDGMFGIANMFGAARVVTLGAQLYHYCVAPPDTHTSCITGMSTSPFWETKDTIWYKRSRLYDTADRIFRAHLSPADATRFGAVRLIDFLLWELILYTYNGAPHRGIAYEINRVLHEPAFRAAVETKRRCGVALQPLGDLALAARVETLVSATAALFAEKDSDLRPFYVCLDLFAALFLEETGTPDTLDITAAALRDVAGARTPEARYVRRVLATDTAAAFDTDVPIAEVV